MLEPFKYYIRRPDGTVVTTTSAREWGEWVHTSLDRFILRTTVNDATVSTVFLPLDHNFTGEGPPVLWETMVFGGLHDLHRENYTSEADAIARHEEIVEQLKSAHNPWKEVIAYNK